ncbi:MULTISPECIES: YraN family protein [Pseudoxanthomonas]|jgi:putative endonuclease|uniref:YraN family protein n=1 Tax=Pseudoxanthomonas TaxID=83618 RepID=UPI00138A64FD|nr:MULTISPECIES: YraN family protein [Pseudoxanthomonas]MBP6797924.1 YraN family protein [Luteimonas sp.]KAF1729067.1 YraN family protein [Pseudoxanthomonas mexicana]MBP7657650.1 YraN family protein [Pseudoxanthomonas sp.]MCH2090000.1 YraN family protein [Pseudoxanthomonas sp.]HMM26109.1 YraN family protein [Pseudoxanthomonas mexicana]
MAVDRRARGHAVEVAARDLLQRAGLTELATNANYRGGELDLVMQDATRSGTPTVVFVEVRYRQSQAFGGGMASIDTGKRRRLVHAAQRFLQDHPALADAPCRFDVVDAQGDPASPRLDWIRDAFRADEV